MNSRGKNVCRVLVLGASRVGKTSLISQFMLGSSPHRQKNTKQKLQQKMIAIDFFIEVEEIGGSFAQENPDILNDSMLTADVVLLVFSIACPDSLKVLKHLKNLVMEAEGKGAIVVVAGNKSDLLRKVEKEVVEELVIYEWKNEYVECSAHKNINIMKLFKDILKRSYVQKMRGPQNAQRVKSVPKTKSQSHDQEYESFKSALKTKFVRRRSKSDGERKEEEIEFHSFENNKPKPDKIRNFGEAKGFSEAGTSMISKATTYAEKERKPSKKSSILFRARDSFLLRRSKSQPNDKSSLII